MKKNVLIVVCFLLSFSLFSQEENVYLYISNSNNLTLDIGNNYKGYFNIKSKDKRFNHDVYTFTISQDDPYESKSVFDLGERISLESYDCIKPEQKYKDIENHDLHEELSLKKRIFIIMKIPNNVYLHNNEGQGKYIMWHVQYSGTVKNIVFPPIKRF